MKELGCQLKEIRQRLLDEGNETLFRELGDEVAMTDARALPMDRLEQFQNLMVHVVAQAIETSNERLGEQVSEQVSQRVLKEMNYQLRMREEREEERYKKLDEALRNVQKSRKLQAEMPDQSRIVQMKKKRGLFGRNRKEAEKENRKTRFADMLS